MQQINEKKKRRRRSQRKLITVAVASDPELASQYKNILQRNGIVAMVRTGTQTPDVAAEYDVALLVQEDKYDQAYELLLSYNGSDGFFEGVMDSQQAKGIAG